MRYWRGETDERTGDPAPEPLSYKGNGENLAVPIALSGVKSLLFELLLKISITLKNRKVSAIVSVSNQPSPGPVLSRCIRQNSKESDLMVVEAQTGCTRSHEFALYLRRLDEGSLHRSRTVLLLQT